MLVDIPKYKLLRQDLVTEVNQLIAKARSILGEEFGPSTGMTQSPVEST